VQGGGGKVTDLGCGPAGVLGDERAVELIFRRSAMLAAAVFGFAA
jgi:hypothetical protein